MQAYWQDNKSVIGIIGGSGIYEFPGGYTHTDQKISTEFGDVCVNIIEGEQHRVIFICRHGAAHSVPPHNINYRANIRAFHELGVCAILATNAVGSICSSFKPGFFSVPDQIIDYTYGREHTFYNVFSSDVQHAEFSYPFSATLRDVLIATLEEESIGYCSHGVYACTQGPRLESAAEIRRIEKDGATMVGMTLMPEASLARELHIPYASLCFSVNWAAGISSDSELISIEEIRAYLNDMSERLAFMMPILIKKVLSSVVS